MAEIGKFDASLHAELCAYYEWGLSVFVDDQAYGTEKMKQVCQVLEEDQYMRDYEEGEMGKVVAVNFTKIGENSKGGKKHYGGKRSRRR